MTQTKPSSTKPHFSVRNTYDSNDSLAAKQQSRTDHKSHEPQGSRSSAHSKRPSKVKSFQRTQSNVALGLVPPLPHENEAQTSSCVQPRRPVLLRDYLNATVQSPACPLLFNEPLLNGCKECNSVIEIEWRGQVRVIATSQRRNQNTCILGNQEWEVSRRDDDTSILVYNCYSAMKKNRYLTRRRSDKELNVRLIGVKIRAL